MLELNISRSRKDQHCSSFHLIQNLQYERERTLFQNAFVNKNLGILLKFKKSLELSKEQRQQGFFNIKF